MLPSIIKCKREKGCGPSEIPFGFQRRRPTVDVVNLVINILKAVPEEDRCCAIITVDVKNGFNSAKWPNYCSSYSNKAGQ